MYADAEIDRVAEQYLDSEFSLPEWRVPFHRYLASEAARPAHHIHREEKGGITLARIAVAIRKAAGRPWSR